ncbi:ABC transporter substrate-binding protein [Chloroflexota bacterium]
MKGKKIIWSVVSSLMVLALLISSCGPAGTPTQAPTPSEGAGIEVPKHGGEMTYLCFKDTSFDDVYTTPYDCFTMHLTHDKLYTGDWSKGLGGTGEFSFTFGMPTPEEFRRGQACESWELTDPGTLTFHIRKGIRFHDAPPVNGRELDAEDVAVTIRRHFETTGSYVSKNHKNNMPTSIEAVGNTVVVKGPPENIGPIHRDITLEMHVVPREVIEKFGDVKDWKNQIGSGPYTLVDYVEGNSWTMERNPDYWDIDPLFPQNKVPYVDKITGARIKDKAAQMAAMRTSKVDVWWGYYLIRWEEAKSLRESNPELKWMGEPGTSPMMMYMRTDLEPFGDIRVRRALGMAINNQEIADTYYGGEAVVFCFPVVPYDMKPFNQIFIPLEQHSKEAQMFWGYYPEEAKKLLAEAGYPDGFKTNVICSPEDVPMMSILQSYWSDIGVDCEIDVKEKSVWKAIHTKHEHDQMIAKTGTMAQPWKFVAHRPGPAQNLSIIDDPVLNEAYDTIAANFFDDTAKIEAWQSIVRHLTDQAYYVQLPVSYNYAVWQPWIKNYHGEYGIGYHSHWNWGMYLWVDQELKKKMGH